MAARHDRAPPRAGALIEWLAVLLAVGYVACFGAWNATTDLELKYWFATEPARHPSFFPVLGAFTAGFLLAFVLAGLGAVRRAAELRAMRRRLNALEEELHGLRTLPLQEDSPGAD